MACTAVVLCFMIVRCTGCEQERNQRKTEVLQKIVEENAETGVIIIDDQRMP